MSDERRFHEMNEQELKKFREGVLRKYRPSTRAIWSRSLGRGCGYLFRCPVCNTEIEVKGVGCEVGEVGGGGHCPNCMNQTGQWVGMIRIT